MINWNNTHAAIWRPAKAQLRSVQHIDPIQLTELVGIEQQKQSLLDNTRRFVSSQPANNALLWGSRGTGKSSLIKAVFNQFRAQGLRMIQVDKADLLSLHDIVDDLREELQHFIIYCDDLSFDTGDASYRGLKTVLEGSIELPPKNVLVYATSNRRNLVPESMKDNLASTHIQGEVHYADAIEEKISLADRFGLRLSFYSITQQEFLDIVDNYFREAKVDKELLHKEALQFAAGRGARSGRIAKQFYNYFIERE